MVKYPTPPYQLYSINKATSAMTQLAEGYRADMGREMNARRHTTSKEVRYAIYQGRELVSATNN